MESSSRWRRFHIHRRGDVEAPQWFPLLVSSACWHLECWRHTTWRRCPSPHRTQEGPCPLGKYLIIGACFLAVIGVQCKVYRCYQTTKCHLTLAQLPSSAETLHISQNISQQFRSKLQDENYFIHFGTGLFKHWCHDQLPPQRWDRVNVWGLLEYRTPCWGQFLCTAFEQKSRRSVWACGVVKPYCK